MRFILGNVALFLFMAAVLSYQYFFQVPYENAVLMASTATARAPAAVPVVIPKAAPEKTLADLDWKFDLNCRDSEKEVSRTRDFVILNLKKCGKEFPKEISIENQTNGFTASLFAVNDSYSKTDSIPLKKGKNVITIRYLLSKAKAAAPTPIVEKLILQHE